jgi:hypothetical protein
MKHLHKKTNTQIIGKEKDFMVAIHVSCVPPRSNRKNEPVVTVPYGGHSVYFKKYTSKFSLHSDHPS